MRFCVVRRMVLLPHDARHDAEHGAAVEPEGSVGERPERPAAPLHRRPLCRSRRQGAVFSPGSGFTRSRPSSLRHDPAIPVVRVARMLRHAILVLHVPVHVLPEQEFAEPAPARGGQIALLHTVAGQVGRAPAAANRRCSSTRLLLDLRLAGEELPLELALDELHVPDHVAPARVGPVGDEVEDVERRVPGEVLPVAGADGEAVRHGADAAVHRRVDGAVGVVEAEPEHAADRVGQVAPHLRNEREPGLLRGDGPLVEVVVAVDLPVHRPPAVGQLVRTGSDALRQVHRRVLEVVAHHLHDVAHGELVVGLHPHRQLRGGDVAHDVVGRQIQRRRDPREAAPDTRLAGAQGAEFERIVGVGEAEVRIRAIEPPPRAGEVDHVGRVEAVLRILQREAPDARLVGVAGDVAVRHAHRHPHRALAARPLADHLQDPRLVRVGDRERLPLAVVAVLRHEVGHHPDRLARRLRPREREIHQAAVVDNARRVAQRLAPAEGRFADRHLMLVQIADAAVRDRRLVDLAEVLPGVPLVDRNLLARQVRARRAQVELAVEAVRVGAVGDEGGAVCRGASGHQEIGAGGGGNGDRDSDDAGQQGAADRRRSPPHRPEESDSCHRVAFAPEGGERTGIPSRHDSRWGGVVPAEGATRARALIPPATPRSPSAAPPRAREDIPRAVRARPTPAVRSRGCRARSGTRRPLR